MQAGKPVFLANMTDAKWWRNFSGYSISCQILEAFTKAKIKPLILYKIVGKGLVYQATKTTFYKKGVLVPYGLHRQIVLPIQNWKPFTEALLEPYNLPILTTDEWLKDNQEEEQNRGITFDGKLSAMEKLRQEAEKKGWYKSTVDTV